MYLRTYTTGCFEITNNEKAINKKEKISFEEII